MNPYTVILAVKDKVATNATYLQHVTASDARRAVEIAQHEYAAANPPMDYADVIRIPVIAVFDGFQNDIWDL